MTRSGEGSAVQGRTNPVVASSGNTGGHAANPLMSLLAQTGPPLCGFAWRSRKRRSENHY
jgi:hypothetical protein